MTPKTKDPIQAEVTMSDRTQLWMIASRDEIMSVAWIAIAALIWIASASMEAIPAVSIVVKILSVCAVVYAVYIFISCVKAAEKYASKFEEDSK